MIRMLVTVVAFLVPMARGYSQDAPHGIEDARIEQRSTDDGLAPAFDDIVRHADGVCWIGYTVPMRREFQVCCTMPLEDNDPCRLEHHENYLVNSNRKDFQPDERNMRVMFRVEDNQVDRIRAYSEGCNLDLSGLVLYWLTGVEDAESIDLLERLTMVEVHSSKVKRRRAEHAISAIGLHDHRAAYEALIRMLDSDRPEFVRKDAVFWTAIAGGRRALDPLINVLHGDPSTDVRNQVVFALTEIDDPEAVDLLIKTARHDRDSDIRSQALFWLSQEAGDRAAETLTQAVEDDPDTDVKKYAVFAISQLPNERSIPLLIRLARTNRNPEVREQAIFWLGQSEDNRAIDFFEEILTN